MAAAKRPQTMPVDSLDFLPPLNSDTAPRDIGTILVISHGQAGPHRISGLSLPYLEQVCPVLAAAFDIRRHGAMHGMEGVSYSAVVSLLRFIYTDKYPPLAATSPASDSLYTQLEVVKLAQIYAVEALERAACTWIKDRLALGKQDQTRPQGLILGIRYAYKSFKCDAPVIEAILNYCVCNLIHHDLVADQEFIALLQDITYFHQDLCTVALHSKTHYPEAQLLIRIGSDLQRERNISRSSEEAKKMKLMATAMFDRQNKLLEAGPQRQSSFVPVKDPYGPSPSMNEHAAQLTQQLLRVTNPDPEDGSDIPDWTREGNIDAMDEDPILDPSHPRSNRISGWSTSVERSQLSANANPPPYSEEEWRVHPNDTAARLRRLRSEYGRSQPRKKSSDLTNSAPLTGGRAEIGSLGVGSTDGLIDGNGPLKERIKRARLDYLQQLKLVGEEDQYDSKVQLVEGEFWKTELQGQMLTPAQSYARRKASAERPFRFGAPLAEQNQSAQASPDELAQATQNKRYSAKAFGKRPVVQDAAKLPSYATRSAGPLSSKSQMTPRMSFNFGEPLSPPPNKPLPQPLAPLAIRAKPTVTPPDAAKPEKDDWHRIDLASPAISDSNAAEDEWTMISGPATANTAPAPETDGDWIICDAK